MRILVVDDVPVVRLVIAKALRRAGHAVAEADNGLDALQQASGDKVDVVVSDIWMPGMDGLDLIQSLKQCAPHAGVVAMSGGNPRSTMAGTLADAMAVGADVTIMKPIDKDELLAAVDRAACTVKRNTP
ncbi:MAG: response regulator [Bacteroidales bacterium]